MGDKSKSFVRKRVYYGEYSLKHWLNLIIGKNIVLPDYQRHFVWEEPDVKRLMESLKSGQFVMPVTIAHYTDSTTSKNLILDGQQRLTSILLTEYGSEIEDRPLQYEKEYSGISSSALESVILSIFLHP